MNTNISGDFSEIDTLSINTIRTLSIDCIQKANSGHPGLPLGAAPMAYVLWQRHLKHAPSEPRWPNRDRFILSAGHGSMLLYSLLHLSGYPLSMDELKNFRQKDSLTPGHPEYDLTAGVEATTGPLGQGSANAIGMAIAEKYMSSYFNRPGFDLIDHYTYALVSDGDLMEGISAEAASIAGHLGLGKLIYLYDSNDVTLDGPADLAFTENIAKRYESYDWQVLVVQKGDTDLSSIDEALKIAKIERAKPTLIIVKTTIGFGSPNKQGKSSSHGSPLGVDEVKLTKNALKWNFQEDFYIPNEVKENFLLQQKNGEVLVSEWQTLFGQYSKQHPELAKAWNSIRAGILPDDLFKNLTNFVEGEQSATRESSGKILNEIAKKFPLLIGGDADLSCSTNTYLKDAGAFSKANAKGRNIHYGVREHAMGAIANGIAYHKGLRTFTATFFCFSDYMKPAIRLASMNHLPVIFIFTHDSIGLGEDGPTHQPIEHLMALRNIPNLNVIRPADPKEVIEAWKIALNSQTTPTALVLSRQKLPHYAHSKLKQTGSAENGGYVISDCETQFPKIILIATGSEVSLAFQAKETLEKDGIPTRIVSMPSFEIFSAQDQNYKDSVLIPSIHQRISIEAGSTLGWERFVGDKGKVIGIDRFGLSCPAPRAYEELGLPVNHIVQTAKSLL